MVSLYAQTVLQLQQHVLEVSFAAVQLLHKILCTDSAYPIPQQCAVTAHIFDAAIYFNACRPIPAAVGPRSCSPLSLGWDCWVATDLVG